MKFDKSNILKFVVEVKKLAIILTFDFKEDDDILGERNKFYASFNIILPKLYSADFTFIYVKFIVFNFTVSEVNKNHRKTR